MAIQFLDATVFSPGSISALVTTVLSGGGFVVVYRELRASNDRKDAEIKHLTERAIAAELQNDAYRKERQALDDDDRRLRARAGEELVEGQSLLIGHLATMNAKLDGVLLTRANTEDRIDKLHAEISTVMAHALVKSEAREVPPQGSAPAQVEVVNTDPVVVKVVNE